MYVFKLSFIDLLLNRLKEIEFKKIEFKRLQFPVQLAFAMTITKLSDNHSKYVD